MEWFSCVWYHSIPAILPSTASCGVCSLCVFVFICAFGFLIRDKVTLKATQSLEGDVSVAVSVTMETELTKTHFAATSVKRFTPIHPSFSLYLSLPLSITASPASLFHSVVSFSLTTTPMFPTFNQSHLEGFSTESSSPLSVHSLSTSVFHSTVIPCQSNLSIPVWHTTVGFRHMLYLILL